MPMGRSEQSERPYFYPRRAHLLTTCPWASGGTARRWRQSCAPAEVAPAKMGGRGAASVLRSKTAEKAKFADAHLPYSRARNRPRLQSVDCFNAGRSASVRLVAKTCHRQLFALWSQAAHFLFEKKKQKPPTP